MPSLRDNKNTTAPSVSLPAALLREARLAQELWKVRVDQMWSVRIVGQSPAYTGTRVVNERLENVPAGTCTSQHCRTLCSGPPEQWYYR